MKLLIILIIQRDVLEVIRKLNNSIDHTIDPSLKEVIYRYVITQTAAFPDRINKHGDKHMDQYTPLPV